MVAATDKARQATIDQGTFDPAAYSKLSRKEKGDEIARLFVGGLNTATRKNTPTA